MTLSNSPHDHPFPPLHHNYKHKHDRHLTLSKGTSYSSTGQLPRKQQLFRASAPEPRTRALRGQDPKRHVSLCTFDLPKASNSVLRNLVTSQHPGGKLHTTCPIPRPQTTALKQGEDSFGFGCDVFPSSARGHRVTLCCDFVSLSAVTSVYRELQGRQA